MYIFPGIGLGSILSGTRHVSDGMIERAAVALASSLNAEEEAAGLVYPRLARIRDLSATIALAVIRQAQKEVSDGVVRTGFAIDTPRFCTLGIGREPLSPHSPRRRPSGASPR